MPYTFQQNDNGTVSVFQNGKQISLTTPANAKLTYGYTGQSSLPALSGTPVPPDQPAPPSPTAPQGLPDTTQKSPLLSFADTLNQAVDLARQHRNETAASLMQPLQGTLAAADFGSILGNLNAAFDKTTSDLIKKAGDLNESKYDTVSLGGDLYQVQKDANGQIIGTPQLVQRGSGDTNGPSKVRSGALVTDEGEISTIQQHLNGIRGNDGWTDPYQYKSAYDAWVKNGGLTQDFVKYFPPDQYVNPDAANNWLPQFLRNPDSKKTISNPFR